jgi:hypothetical protein
MLTRTWRRSPPVVGRPDETPSRDFRFRGAGNEISLLHCIIAASLGAMSAILLAYTIDRQYLPVLKDENVLLDHAQRVGQEYDWSGYCMLHTLMYLEERGISFDSADEYTVLTPAHRTLLGQLDPARHDVAELDAYLMEELGDGDDGEESQGWAGEAALDSLRLLHDNLEHLVDSDVLLVQIC